TTDKTLINKIFDFHIVTLFFNYHFLISAFKNVFVSHKIWQRIFIYGISPQFKKKPWQLLQL
ncbi:MAG: hypothetical protein ACYC01_03865, partial [Lutibacter sp.]